MTHEEIAHELQVSRQEVQGCDVPRTMINTGERKSLPLAISWADTLIEKVQRKKQPVVEITRYGIDAKDTRYDFQTIA